MIRRLSSKKEEYKKHKRNQWILGVILVVVMFGSVFGIVANSFGKKGSEAEKIIYKGFEFSQENNYYILEMGTSKFYFLNDPRETDEFEKEVNLTTILSAYSGKTLYLFSEDYQASSLIYQNLSPFATRFQQACESEENCTDESFPIKGCDVDFILLKESTKNKIYQNESCIYIEGKKEDLSILVDEFILNIIGVK